MSMFLGPIHFWLYNKIIKQEEFTEIIAEYAKKNNYISNSNKYIKSLPPLEEVIDESNIHGWLQTQIHDAETRYANLVIEILSGNNERIHELEGLAFDYGKKYPTKPDLTAEEVFKTFEEFFLSGMPCDRINTIIKSNSDHLIWEQALDIHESYWTNNNDSSKTYYILRTSIMHGMLCDRTFYGSSNDNNTYVISK